MEEEEEDDTMIRIRTLPFRGYYTGFNAPSLFIRAQCCVMMLYRVSGEGYGCQESIARLVNQPRTFIRTYLHTVATVCW